MSHVLAPPAPPAPPAHAALHSVSPGDIAVGVVIGRASEYFDFFVYGIASVLVFPALFFPFASSPLVGCLMSFVVFSFAFIARPVGTVLAMEVQRRWGRSSKSAVALFMLGASTVGIAFLPGYDTLGFAAIVLLAVFRIGQGLGLGGSWDGLPSLLALSAPPERRGWYAMLGQLGAPAGFIVASSLFAFLYGYLETEDFLDWGWRYPFFVSFAINVVALFARLRLTVAKEYAELFSQRELEPSDTGELVRLQGHNLFLGAFAALASYALFHLVTVFPLSWIRLYTDQSISGFLMVQVLGGFLAAGGVFASGWIADRYGRRGTLAALAGLIAVFSGYAPTLLGGGTAGQNAFILIGFTLLGVSYGQAAGTVTSNLESRFRYTGAALTSDLAWLLGAGFAPLVALGMSAYFGLAWAGVYLLSGAACTLVALGINKAIESENA